MDYALGEGHADQCGCCPGWTAHSLVANGAETEANGRVNSMWEEEENRGGWVGRRSKGKEVKYEVKQEGKEVDM